MIGRLLYARFASEMTPSAASDDDAEQVEHKHKRMSDLPSRWKKRVDSTPVAAYVAGRLFAGKPVQSPKK